MAREARCLCKFEVQAAYSTSDNELLDEFLVPALSCATRYDRAVGFFSSSLTALAAVAMGDFVSCGGKTRIVCSPHLSPTDIAWLALDADEDEPHTGVVVSHLKALAEADNLAGALITAMSSMVQNGCLEMKFARPAFGSGIFHDKIGIFHDADKHRLSFVGSANETAAAWSGLGNHEQIETFGSWLSAEQLNRSERHERQFEELWLGLRRGVQVDEASASAAVLLQVSPPESVDIALDKVREVIEERRRELGRSSRRVLRPHQEQVLASWRSADRRGIVVFATGGGKTLTGLSAVREWIGEGRPAIIAVPSRLLLAQWHEEVRRELPDVPVVLCGGDNPRDLWVSNLSLLTTNDPELGPRIVLTTYDTGVSEDFLARVHGGEHLLIVGDEVHRLGAPNRRRFLTIDATARLGLGATPERYGDPDGTAAIFDYFGERLTPEFGIKEAIDADLLVPYDYHFDTVTLLDNEQESWDKLSREIAQAIARNDGVPSDRAKFLALKRSRIMKSAAMKAPTARRILDREYRRGDRWLVYCDSRSHLNAVRQAIETPERQVLEFHYQNSHLADEIFQHFESGGILLAIRCLDEGIDLPYINKALILASTTNPREYIQRRGRLLRTFPGKYSAQVFDVLVVDDEGLPLATSEARRAIRFAHDASNLAGKVQLEMLLDRALRRDTWRRDETSFEDEGE